MSISVSNSNPFYLPNLPSVPSTYPSYSNSLRSISFFYSPLLSSILPSHPSKKALSSWSKNYILFILIYLEPGIAPDAKEAQMQLSLGIYGELVP
jgi:hypothetical protein